jgi:hypothetical protein
MIKDPSIIRRALDEPSSNARRALVESWTPLLDALEAIVLMVWGIGWNDPSPLAAIRRGRGCVEGAQACCGAVRSDGCDMSEPRDEMVSALSAPLPTPNPAIACTS